MDNIEAAKKPHDASQYIWTTPGGRVGELLGTALGAISLLTVISLWTFSPTDISLSASSTQATENAIGPVGAYMADALLQAFGLGAYFFAFLLAVASYRAWAGEPFVPRLTELLGAAATGCSGGILLHLCVHADGTAFPYGGLVGAVLGAQGAAYFGQLGTIVLAISLFLMGTTLLTGGVAPRFAERLTRVRAYLRHEAARRRQQTFSSLEDEVVESAPRVATLLSSFRVARRTKLAPPRKPISGDLARPKIEPRLSDASVTAQDTSAENAQLSLLAADLAAVSYSADSEPDLSSSFVSNVSEKGTWTITDKYVCRDESEDALVDEGFSRAVADLGTGEGFEARFGGVIDHREPLLMDGGSLPAHPQSDVGRDLGDLSEVSFESMPHEAPAVPASLVLSTKTLPSVSPLPSLALLAEGEGGFTTPSPVWLEDKLRDLEAILAAADLPTALTLSAQGPAVCLVRASPVGPSSDIAGYTQSVIALFTRPQRDLGIRVVVNSAEPQPIVTLEVPLPVPRTPSLRNCLEQIQGLSEPTRVTFGTDVCGETASIDLATSGAMLLAGAPQTGKTSALRALITSLAFRATPEEVQLILIDCEGGALSCFSGLPHLALPLVTDARHAAQALRWILNEAEDRNADLLADATGRRDMSEKTAQIVVVIDELAPLMQTVPSDVESFVSRIAPIGRVAGVSLVVATRAPHGQILTGALKNHLPTRLTFRVDDRRTGRALLEEGGAELLLAAGDALYSASPEQPAERRHCVLMAATEAEGVTASLRQTLYAGGAERPTLRSAHESAAAPNA